MYRYRRHHLLLVQVNTDIHREKGNSMLPIFIHLITDSNAMCLTVYFFSFLPQIWLIQNQYLMIKQKFSDGEYLFISGEYVLYFP
jgi:hypothetical protein